MAGFLRTQALGALGRGCGHYSDQTERGESLSEVSITALTADLRLCLLRMPGERDHLYARTHTHTTNTHAVAELQYSAFLQGPPQPQSSIHHIVYRIMLFYKSHYTV